MIFVRIEWLILVAFTVMLAIGTAIEPMWWTSECQLGLLPTELISDWDDCTTSTYDFYGAGLLVPLALPVALCAIPILAPRRLVAWGVAATLVALIVIAILLGNRPFPGDGLPLAFVGYCLPSVFVAILLAWFHRCLDGTGLTT
ncbi:hypothetical protein [Prescottella equi]|uniref:Uncharacterized protein n=1 Tax=Prescottella equi ATCC 33707 TaxID=525370 RepID=E9T653_RHOHA|nr:hypothetical protein [Prescottella equi]EGD22040.1 hypothetical protein HMPREF0724_14259 [Prescottella equi ATCC 33707]